MNLFEWTNAYIDSINFFKKNLLKKEIINKNLIKCEYKDKKEVFYYISDVIDDSCIEFIKNNFDKKIVIVSLNRKENMSLLINYWEAFIKNKDLKFIFSNPKENLFWAIVPYTHNLISGNLKLGIKTLFESIPYCE
ncbi:MAG: hypothetical protein QXE31_00420 [Candidatus Woesearchaeota archaeon]